MISIEQLAMVITRIDDMSDRLAAVARLTTGNIVEIGGGEGINTLRFIKIAAERQHTAVVIDPFDMIQGADESYFKPYSLGKFLETVENNCSQDELYHLHLIYLPSQSPEALERLKAGYIPIGFMFIDGLQDKESVMSDIRLAVSLDVDVICIDDYDRLTECSQVPLAVDSFRGMLVQYDFVYSGQREIYLVRK